MNDFNFDYQKLLDLKIECELSKNEQIKPLVLVLRKYGITGMQAISFLADLATAAQHLQNGNADE